MKIRPIIMCGGEGTRLWPNIKKYEAKQFIDFGNWTLLGKTLERIKSSIYDIPIISTNLKYLKQIKQHLKKHKIKKFKIVLEPVKRNTAPAILSASLIREIPEDQPLIFLSSDHLIEKTNIFNKSINENKKNLSNENIFIFGIKPTSASNEYGYFVTKKIKKNLNKVKKFIEKPIEKEAKKIIRLKGLWNSGMIFLKKKSIINNFKKYQPKIYNNCLNSLNKAKFKNNIYYLNKVNYIKNKAISFDYALLEKSKNINAIKLDIPWSDLGSWKQICEMYNDKKKKYFKKENVYIKPWGKYINLYKGKNFLIKELHLKPKSSLSLQKHFYRSEHWLITKGNPKITINKKVSLKKPSNTVYVPKGCIHRIENPFNNSVKIIEAQTGVILKETDITRFKDIYGRIK